jgi:hypothetical protein
MHFSLILKGGAYTRGMLWQGGDTTGRMTQVAKGRVCDVLPVHLGNLKLLAAVFILAGENHRIVRINVRHASTTRHAGWEVPPVTAVIFILVLVVIPLSAIRAINAKGWFVPFCGCFSHSDY